MVMLAISSGENRASVSRMSHECRETFANESCDNRTTFVRLSQICLIHLFGVTAMLLWLQCRISVAKTCLKLVSK